MRSALIVAGGGAAGASVRWSVGELLASQPGTFPWATLIVNVAGCAAIGVAARRLQRDSELWLAVVVGVLGGLTTFSAFASETRGLVDADRPGLAIAYVAVTAVAGIAGTEIARADRFGRP